MNKTIKICNTSSEHRKYTMTNLSMLEICITNSELSIYMKKALSILAFRICPTYSDKTTKMKEAFMMKRSDILRHTIINDESLNEHCNAFSENALHFRKVLFIVRRI